VGLGAGSRPHAAQTRGKESPKRARVSLLPITPSSPSHFLGVSSGRIVPQGAPPRRSSETSLTQEYYEPLSADFCETTHGELTTGRALRERRPRPSVNIGASKRSHRSPGRERLLGDRRELTLSEWLNSYGGQEAYSPSGDHTLAGPRNHGTQR